MTQTKRKKYILLHSSVDAAEWFDQRVPPIFRHFANHKHLDLLDPYAEHTNFLMHITGRYTLP
jgi:hypothetical protein